MTDPVEDPTTRHLLVTFKKPESIQEMSDHFNRIEAVRQVRASKVADINNAVDLARAELEADVKTSLQDGIAKAVIRAFG